MELIKIKHNFKNEIIQKLFGLIIGFMIGKIILSFNPNLIHAPIQGASVGFDFRYF